ncbi:MAG: hypothetical protein HYV95_14285 [Opitutae bacterium]|nr:hypothetical protein [Opitutae bacterium]
MAWRIDEQVIRGEIDNRTRGRVIGRIWLVDRAEPVELDLQGNCWRDLAGRRLEFVNLHPQPGLAEGFVPRQTGVAGDITASRKVKVPDIPINEIGDYYAAKKQFPWHWGNSLYLEWFNERNGRIVIESATFGLTVVGEPAWEMTAEEEIEQRKSNGAALTGFMDRLGEAANAADHEEKDDEPPEWDEKPQTEGEAEDQQARSDLLVDRVQARMEREGAAADLARITEEEIARLRRERGEPEPSPEQRARNAEWMEEMNRAAAEAEQNPDPALEEQRDGQHPLAERAFEFTLQLHQQAETEGWLRKNAGPEHPVAELVNATSCAGAKLAGALNGRDWPPELELCASVIVRLKRARGYLDDALRATESCQEEKLIAPAQLGPIVVELVDLARDTDELITELRARLERGVD